jgi:hypothetical protein
VFVRSVSVLEARLHLCGACVKLGYFQLVTSFLSLENLLKNLPAILLFKGDFRDPRCDTAGSCSIPITCMTHTNYACGLGVTASHDRLCRCLCYKLIAIVRFCSAI